MTWGGVLVGVDLSRGLWSHLRGKLWTEALTHEILFKKEQLIVRYCCGEISPRDFYAEILKITGLKMSYAEFVQS